MAISSKPLNLGRLTIHVCYKQQTLVLQGKIPITQVWAIVEIITSTLVGIVSSCVQLISWLLIV